MRDDSLLFALSKVIGAPNHKYIPTVTKLRMIRNHRVKSGVSVDWIRKTHGFRRILGSNREVIVNNRKGRIV